MNGPSDQISRLHSPEQDPTLASMAQTLWRHRRWFLVIYGLIISGTFVALIIIPPDYTIRATIASAEATPEIFNTSISGPQRASLLPASSVTSAFEQFKAVMTSVKVARRLSSRPDLISAISTSGVIKEGSESEAKSYALAAYIRAHLNIRQKGRSGLWRLTLQTTDREFGIAILQALFEETSNAVRQQQLLRLDIEIGELKRQRPLVNNAAVRKMLLKQLFEYEQRRLLLEAGVPVGAQLVIAPRDAPMWPYPLVAMRTLIFALLLGPLAAACLIGGGCLAVQLLRQPDAGFAPAG